MFVLTFDFNNLGHGGTVTTGSRHRGSVAIGSRDWGPVAGGLSSDGVTVLIGLDKSDARSSLSC